MSCDLTDCRNEKEVASVETAHDSIVWSLAWHPLGHILASASNDHTTKFWTRNRPGDRMRDRYNLNMLPIGTSEEMLEFDDDTSALPVIPGMGLEHGLPDHLKKPEEENLGKISSFKRSFYLTSSMYGVFFYHTFLI